MATDPDDITTFIDLYENQTPLPTEDDIISNYFCWDDVDIKGSLVQDDALSSFKPTQLNTIIEETEDTTSSSIQLAESIDTSILQSDHDNNHDDLDPAQSTSIHENDITTQYAPELQRLDEDIHAQLLIDLDIESRLHKLLLGSSNQPVVLVTWEEADNSSRPSAWVLEKIDEVFSGWMEVITNTSRLLIKLRVHERRLLQTNAAPSYTWRTIVYPGTCHRDIFKFGAFMRILELITEAIKSDKIYTKRDIYYKDVALFKTQQTVNNLVDDIAAALGVPRRALHITAAAKGLVCGDMKIFKTDGSIINCNIVGEGVLIPTSSDIEKVRIWDSDAVLIIEKEAVFRTLTESGDWRRLPGRPILLCVGPKYLRFSTLTFLDTFPRIYRLSLLFLT
ncbi:hypothetical protein TWF694_010549 [Orbilia ellipsospora]|uniref:Spo11/DNA topoisomerase VI subunit A N-terminal domain-containing protein n=1 Tax=Orbilia ellipsospora TaxID=2528407 RepID=A0AAV9XBK2_9PEZI